MVLATAGEETASSALSCPLRPGLLSRLKELAVNMSRPSVQHGFYVSLVEFNPRQLWPNSGIYKIT